MREQVGKGAAMICGGETDGNLWQTPDGNPLAVQLASYATNRSHADRRGLRVDQYASDARARAS